MSAPKTKFAPFGSTASDKTAGIPLSSSDIAPTDPVGVLKPSDVVKAVAGTPVGATAGTPVGVVAGGGSSGKVVFKSGDGVVSSGTTVMIDASGGLSGSSPPLAVEGIEKLTLAVDSLAESIEKIKGGRGRRKVWAVELQEQILEDLHSFGATVLRHKTSTDVSSMIGSILQQIPALTSQRQIRAEEFRRFIRWAIAHKQQADDEVMTAVIHTLHAEGVLLRDTVNEVGRTTDLSPTPVGKWLREFDGEDTMALEGKKEASASADSKNKVAASVELYDGNTALVFADNRRWMTEEAFMDAAARLVASKGMSKEFAAQAADHHRMQLRAASQNFNKAKASIEEGMTQAKKAAGEKFAGEVADLRSTRGGELQNGATGSLKSGAGHMVRTLSPGEAMDLLCKATDLTASMLNGGGAIYDKAAKNLIARWNSEDPQEALEPSNIQHLDPPKGGRKRKDVFLEAYNHLWGNIVAEDAHYKGLFPAGEDLYELAKELEDHRVSVAFGGIGLTAPDTYGRLRKMVEARSNVDYIKTSLGDAAKDAAKEDAPAPKNMSARSKTVSESLRDDPMVWVAGYGEGVGAEDFRRMMATLVARKDLTIEDGRLAMASYAKLGDHLAEIEKQLLEDPERGNNDTKSTPTDTKTETKKTMAQKALDIVKADAKEIALRTGVKRTRKIIADKIASFWTSRSVQRNPGETDAAFQERLDAQRGVVAGFLTSEAGQDALSYAIGFAWPMMADQITDPKVREYGDMVAREIRIQGGTNLLDGFLTEVAFPLLGVLTEEATKFGAAMSGAGTLPGLQAATTPTNVRVDGATDHDRAQDAEMAELKARLRQTEERLGLVDAAAKAATAAT